MPSLTKEGLIAGAKQAAEDGLSFDGYCELISKVVISGQTVDEVKALLKSHGLDVYFESGQLFVSEICAQYRDENDLFRVITKRIYEAYDAELKQWHLKRVEYVFEDPDYPVPSEPLNVSVETRHGWLIPPEWEFDMEVWVYTRQPADRPPKGHAYDHESLVGIIR